MNEESEQLELVTPTEEAPPKDCQPDPESPKANESPTPSDIRTIIQECFADFKPTEEPPTFLAVDIDPLAGYDPKFAGDIRRLLDQQAQAIHAEYSPLMVASIATQAVDRVAADCSANTKQYIRAMVAKMEPQVAKAMIEDPKGIEVLEHIAFGLEAKANKAANIPRTSDPGSSDSEESNVESTNLKEFMRAFGVDRKRATELYRDAQRSSR